MADDTLLNADKEAVMLTARAALKEPLKDAIDVFPQQVSEAFSLDDHGRIIWRHGEESFPIARLEKTADFYVPNLVLLHNDLLEDAQNKMVLARLEAWLQEQFNKHLTNLLALKDADITGIGKGIAFRLYEHGGMMLRSDLQEILATLPKEERPALNKLGVRLGAYYVYQRDMLKPAAVHLKAVLWRLFNKADADKTTLPQVGNVSMACPEQGNRAFYTAIGFPVFGKTCVRVDMVERLNSAVFDGAVDGKYKFDPALASTVGVSVETVQFILHDLGFRYDETTETAETTIAEVKTAETATEAEAPVTTTTRFYHVKKRPPRLNTPHAQAKSKPSQHDRKNAKADKGKKPHQRAHDKSSRTAPQIPPRNKAKTSSGWNAFAELAALKK